MTVIVDCFFCFVFFCFGRMALLKGNYFNQRCSLCVGLYDSINLHLNVSDIPSGNDTEAKIQE